MAKLSKRAKNLQEKIETRPYKAMEALKVLKETSTAKFNETAEAHISLRLDPIYAMPKHTIPKVNQIAFLIFSIFPLFW